MKIKILSLFLMAGMVLSGEILNTEKRMEIFYETNNVEAFELEKQHLLELLKFRGKKYARGATDLILPLASRKGDLTTIGFLKKIDPENYRIYFEEGKIYLTKWKILRALERFSVSFRKFISTPEGFYFSAFFFSRTLVLTFVFFLFIMSLALLFWYAPLLFHDLMEKARKPVSASLLFIAVLIFPIVLFPGYGYLVFYFPALFSLYILEESFTRNLLLITLIFALFSAFVPRSSHIEMPRDAAIMERIYYYDNDPETLRIAERTLKEKWDQDLAYYLAKTYKDMGNFQRAVEMLNQILKENPSHYKALVSLAHIRFLSREIQRSMDLLKKALNFKKKEIIPLHNLAFVLEHIGRINESAKYSSMGWKLHGKEWDRFSRENQGFVDYEFKKEEIFWKAFKKDSTAGNIPPKTLALFYCFSKPVIWSPVLIGFLILFIALYFREKLPPDIGSAIYCKGCEKPICEKCSHYYYKGYCDECMDRIELTGGSTSSSSMSIKVIKVRNTRRLLKDIFQEFFNFLYPGAIIFKEGRIFPSLFSFLYIYSISLFIIGMKLKFPLFFHFFITGFVFYLISLFYLYFSEWRG